MIPIRSGDHHIYGEKHTVHDGKRSYLTHGRAYLAATRLVSILDDSPNPPDEINIYTCPVCHRYHVGTVGGDVDKRQERRQQRTEDSYVPAQPRGRRTRVTKRGRKHGCVPR